MTAINTIIPNLPAGPLMDKEGHMNRIWLQFFQQLLVALQTVAGSTGLVPPSLSSNPANNQFSALTNALNGTFIYDNFIHAQTVRINGVFKQIVTL